MDNKIEEKILQIIDELKNDNLIDPNRTLKVSKDIAMSFKAGILSRNTITYNPKYCEELDDDMIRFCLLHEEGHLKRGQYGVPALFLLVCLGGFPLIYCLLVKANQDLFILSLFFFLFVLLSSIRILTEPFHWDEYNSDEFASKILKEKYGIRKPSKILKRTLDSIPSSLDFSKFHSRLFYAFIEYHPSTEQRVRNIVEFIDEN